MSWGLRELWIIVLHFLTSGSRRLNISFGFPLRIQWLIFSEFLWCFVNHEEKLRRALVVDFPNLPYCCDHFRKVGRSSSLSLSISVLYCMSRGAQDRPLTPPSIKMRPEHLLVGNH